MTSATNTTLYTNAIVITVDAARRVIRDGALLVQDNRIVAVDDSATVKASPLVDETTRVVDLGRKIILPGLINGHVHIIQSLMRGMGEDMEVHAWASCAIWPLEVCLQGDDGYAAARLAMAEMIKTGTTTFLEPMLPSTAGFDRVVQAVEDTGIRACLGKLVKAGHSKRADRDITDVRESKNADMTVASAVDAHSRFHGLLDGRLQVWMASETPRDADEHGFAAMGAACKEHGIRFTMHIAEAPKDIELIRRNYGVSPGEFARNVGATGSHVVLAHVVHIDLDKDLDILAESGTHIAHNPTSNAKLSDGIAPVPLMQEKGINVCLGTDGAPCNNGHDLFRDMHLASILHKAKWTDSSLLPAEHVLEMATINAAKALGLDHEIGSLEVGKKADFIVVNPSGLHTAPYDPEDVGEGGQHPSTIVVHSCSGRDVDTVVIDGKALVEGGEFVHLDETQIVRDARTSMRGVRSRSKVGAQPMKRGWTYA